MARARLVPAELNHDPRLAQLSIESELVYRACWSYLDCEGRMNGSPVSVRGLVALRAQVSGWTDESIEAFMLEWTGTVDEAGNTDPLMFLYAARGLNVCESADF